MIVIAVLASAGIYFEQRPPAVPAPIADPIEQFLATHWANPLAPQGEPPAHFSELEAALAPEACGQCHAAQYRDWRTSLHSRAIGPGILWQFHVLDQVESNRCLRCHAPLAEQKALVALDRRWPGAPATPPPAYVAPDLHRQGLVCAACHVRRHQRFGPARAEGTASAATPLPHGGFTASAAFADSRFCATCHQFPPTGRRLNDKLLENSYEEWRGSRAAQEGRNCQSCHMPDRRHLWRGIHDREMVQRGLARQLVVTRVDGARGHARATLRSVDIGHYFPTYVVAKVYVTLHLRRQGSVLAELAHRVIGRTADVDLAQELADTRIPPGGEVGLDADIELVSGEPLEVELRIEVAPAEHYERMFQTMLERNLKLDAPGHALLREALRQARAKRYRLDSIVVTVPSRPGDRAQRVVN